MAHPPSTRSRPSRFTKPMANRPEANTESVQTSQLPGVLNILVLTQSRLAGLSVGSTKGMESRAAMKSTPQWSAWAPSRFDSLALAERSLAWALAPTITHAAAPKSEAPCVEQSSQLQSP